MPRCLQCGRDVAEAPARPLVDLPSRHGSSAGSGTCPHCGADLDESYGVSGDARYTPIARFSSVAEGGYFAHELAEREGIDTRLALDEHFDAVTGVWKHGVRLFVPENHADQASVRLQELLDGGDDNEPLVADAFDGKRQVFAAGDDTESMASPGMPWGGILLTLTAGSFAIWFAKSLEKPAPPKPGPARNQELKPQTDDLLRALPGGSWVQQTAVGTRVLEFDTDARTARLREDRDGDGQFEREEEFVNLPLN